MQTKNLQTRGRDVINRIKMGQTTTPIRPISR